MKKNVLLAGMCGIVLAFGILAVGCEQSDDDDDGAGKITFTGIASQYNGQYATFRSSGNTPPTGGDYLIGGASYSSLTGVQINGGSVTIPVYLLVDGEDLESKAVPYTGSKSGIKIYLYIKASSSFTVEDLYGDEQYMKDSVNFTNGSATVNVGDGGGNGGGGGGGNGGGDYTLNWAVWVGASYNNFSSIFESKDAPLTPAGSNAGYVTGVSISQILAASPSEPTMMNEAPQTGSFEALLNTQNEGIGVPSALKTAMTAQQSKAPLVGVFQFEMGGQTCISMFHIDSAGN
jgi:hypothetical protein